MSGNEVTHWAEWDERGREWSGDICEQRANSVVSCRASQSEYAWRHSNDIGQDAGISIDRVTGEYSGHFVGATVSRERTGACRRTENPEMTPAPEPVL